MDGEVRYIVKVSKKGQIVIPAKIRRKYNITEKVVVTAGREGIKITPVIPLEELFGADGQVMRQIAKEIVEERRKEIRREEKIRH